jgi:hypothetical protein
MLLHRACRRVFLGTLRLTVQGRLLPQAIPATPPQGAPA